MWPMAERQWKWLQYNHQPNDRTRQVGSLAAGWLSEKRIRAARRLSGILEVVGACVDAEFRQCCSLGSLVGGVLTILVDDESRVYALRLRWLLALRSALAQGCRGSHVAEIKFAVGRGELAFPAGLGGDESEQAASPGKMGQT